jgi:hypothetical protein
LNIIGQYSSREIKAPFIEKREVKAIAQVKKQKQMCSNTMEDEQ